MIPMTTTQYNATATEIAEEFARAARAAQADFEEATTRVQQIALDGTYDAPDRLSILHAAADAGQAASDALRVYQDMHSAALAMRTDKGDDATVRLWLLNRLTMLLLAERSPMLAGLASREIIMEGVKR